MEQKINIAELLKDAPKDFEVDSPIFGKVRIKQVDNDPNYPINIAYDLSSTGECITCLTCYGTLTTEFKDAPCVIFPKGAKTWDNFKAPWLHKHLEPFQKVLTQTKDYRGNKEGKFWDVDIYSHYDSASERHYTILGCVKDNEILPYEGNESLLGMEVK